MSQFWTRKKKKTETGKDGEAADGHVPRPGFAGLFLPRCVGERRVTGAATGGGGGGGGEVLSGRLRPLFCPGQVSVRYYLRLRYFLLAAHRRATAGWFGNAERTGRFCACRRSGAKRKPHLQSLTQVICLFKLNISIGVLYHTISPKSERDFSYNGMTITRRAVPTPPLTLRVYTSSSIHFIQHCI